MRGKGGRCIGLTTLQPSIAECHEILASWNHQGLPKPVQVLLYLFIVLKTGSVRFEVLTALLMKISLLKC